MLKVSNLFRLERFEESDITLEYMRWLKDSEINQYLEVKFTEVTLDSLKVWYRRFDFVESFMWKVVENTSGRTIGTASLYGINRNHSYAHYGYMIGEKSFWGGKTAFSVVAAVFNFAFLELHVENIRAGAYANNVGAITNFLKLGMTHQGTWPNALNYKGDSVDEVLYGISRLKWIEQTIQR